MPLEAPQLDDRRFQDIVDQAKTMIPMYCPEWTDHNVSDPGITLVELFAWMTDLLLYRVNRIPDKAYIKFLEMMGIRLQPPRAAYGSVTFYLSGPQESVVVIKEGTEVATVRTETSPAVVFTTEADLVITPPNVVALMSRLVDPGGVYEWVEHDLRQLDLPGQQIRIFSDEPAVSEALYLGFEHDHTNHVLSLALECTIAGGAGVRPDDPPLRWEVWQGGAIQPWLPCEVEYDGTGGFNWTGDVVLHIPSMSAREVEGVEAYWLRCILTEEQAGDGGYRLSPYIESIAASAVGGTVAARHATTVTNEYLGESNGRPGQTFRLLHTPILARDPDRDHLIVRTPDGESQVWQEVPDFAESRSTDRHYVLDSLDGTLQLGPSLLQPDGTAYRFGEVPPRGSQLYFSRYQHGGGVAGNLPARMLTVLKTSVPYVSAVTNREPTIGGQDAQSLEDAKLRAPLMLRTRTRAVTANDYEFLTMQIPGVARAKCLAPGEQTSTGAEPPPGQVVVVVLPEVTAAQENHRTDFISPDRLTLSAQLQETILKDLNERKPVGIQLRVRQPQFVWVTVQAELHAAQHQLQERVYANALARLYEYLNPYVGGPNKTGWEFGRTLHVSEIYGILQQVPGVEFVEQLQLFINDTGSTDDLRPVAQRLDLQPYAIVCSGRHQVTVS